MSIAVLDSKIGNQLGITNNYFNNSINSLGVSIIQADNTYSLIGVSTRNNTNNLISLAVTVGTSFTNNNISLGSSLTIIENDITTLFNTMNADISALGTSLSNSTSTLQTIIEYVSAALAAADAAFTAFSIAQTINNAFQESEIASESDQIFSLNEDRALMVNLSFPNIGSRFATDESAINLVGISVYNVEADFLNYQFDMLGTTWPANKTLFVLVGSSIANNTNKIDNIVGVNLYNDDYTYFADRNNNKFYWDELLWLSIIGSLP